MEDISNIKTLIVAFGECCTIFSLLCTRGGRTRSRFETPPIVVVSRSLFCDFARQ